MKIVVTGMLVAALVPAGASPAPAHEGGLYVGAPGVWVHQHPPVAAGDALLDADTYSGFSCGFGSSTDDTKLVFDDDRQHGEVDCGPMSVFNAGGAFIDTDPPGVTPPDPNETGGVDSVTMCFAIQLNSSVHGTNVADSGCATQSGAVGALVDTLDYTAVTGDVVYLCTSFSWTGGPKGTGGLVLVDDDDDPSNGDQCSEAKKFACLSPARLTGVPWYSELRSRSWILSAPAAEVGWGERASRMC